MSTETPRRLLYALWSFLVIAELVRLGSCFYIPCGHALQLVAVYHVVTSDLHVTGPYNAHASLLCCASWAVCITERQSYRSVVKLLASEVITSMGHQAILCFTSVCTTSDWMLTLPIGWMAAAGRGPCQICCGMKMEKCIGVVLGQLLGIPQTR